jgi:ribosome biogenesis GTPase
VVVANAELLVIVIALADPPPRTGFIDRCLVAAIAGGLRPVLCLTKSDLAEPAALVEHYTDLDLQVVVTRHDTEPTALTERISGQVSAMIGHSGVGKSTLVNTLVPEARRATGVVSAVGKGRHTSTSVVALPLPHGGWVVDTPGVRSFGLAHVTPADVLAGFDEFVAAAEECRSNCGHLGPPSDPDCVLDAIVARGEAHAGRLRSLRRLLHSRLGTDQETR